MRYVAIWCVGIGACVAMRAHAQWVPPSISAPGYRCSFSGGGEQAFTAQCSRLNQQVPRSAAVRPAAKLRTPYQDMIMTVARHMYVTDGTDTGMNRTVICRVNLLVNAKRQCGEMSDEVFKAVGACVDEKHADSCGLADIRDCCIASSR